MFSHDVDTYFFVLIFAERSHIFDDWLLFFTKFFRSHNRKIENSDIVLPYSTFFNHVTFWTGFLCTFCRASDLCLVFKNFYWKHDKIIWNNRISFWYQHTNIIVRKAFAKITFFFLNKILYPAFFSLSVHISLTRKPFFSSNQGFAFAQYLCRFTLFITKI